MASAAIFTPRRRRTSPSTASFLPPADLDAAALLRTLIASSADIISLFSGKALPFQRRNSRNLLRKIDLLAVLVDCVRESCSELPSAAVISFKEMYLLFHRSKMLLDYCSNSSKLWLLLQNPSISGHFHDLNQEISTLLDVVPLNELSLSEDACEQIELLRIQCRRAKLVIDRHDEILRLKYYWFLNEFESERVPDFGDLCHFFVGKLGIRDVKDWRSEIEFLEEQIANHEGDVEPSASVINGFVAMTRYCRFLICGFEEDDTSVCAHKNKRGEDSITKQAGETHVAIPKDFCCPISLDLMADPVVISTGQTYDRMSISRWIDERHCTCPKTGQMLDHKRLVPNRALRNLILHWCAAHGIPYDPLESAVSSSENSLPNSTTKATMEANKATVHLLVNQLSNGSEGAKAIAAREIRLLSKTGKENRSYIAEAGAIPHLKNLLSSPNPVAQENSVTATLNLSIYEKNKTRIMNETGCLGAIIEVLRFGHTTEARENAAATLFSLSAVHEYKRRIAEEDGAVEALASLLSKGTVRGKKDAITALFNLSTHVENYARLIDSGAVRAIVGALCCESVAEEAAGALALIVRQPIGAEEVGREEAAVSGLISMMRCGSPKGKENAVAALLELCHSGGAEATERILRAPALAGLIRTLLFTGTKRARRKAASLARVFQRGENASFHFGGLGVGYALAGNSAANQDSVMSISVPVL